MKVNKKELANYLVSRLRTELNVTTHNTNDEVLELARAFIISSYDQGYADAKKELTDNLLVVTPEEVKVEKLFDESRGVINEPVSKNEFFKSEEFGNE